MNAIRLAEKKVQSTGSKLNTSNLPGAARRVSAGLLFVLLGLSILLVGSASAAGRVPSAPCEVCANASDPFQYSFMAELEASASTVETNLASFLSIDRVSDPLQYTFMVRRAESREDSSEIRRLTGLAGPGAGSSTAVAEVVRLRGFLEASEAASVGLAQDAEINRLWGLAGAGSRAAVTTYEEARLYGLLEAARSASDPVCC